MKKMENMRCVLEMMEKKLVGCGLIRQLKNDGIASETEIMEISAEQFFNQMRVAALRITRLGLAGEHIGIIGRNSYDWLVNLCAIFWTGSVAVLIDRELETEKIISIVNRVNLKALICDEEAERMFEKVEIPVKIVKSLPKYARGRTIESYEDRILRKKSKEDLACIFFTSGTTAESKAVMMSEGALAAGVCHNINRQKFQSILGILPFHHLSGFSSVLNAMYLGAEVCIGGYMTMFFEYLDILKPDYIFVVPSMMRMLAKRLRKGGHNGRKLGWNLHVINCGGAVFCSDVLQELKENGIVVLQGYGASEAGGIGFLWEMDLERPDTIGKPPIQLKTKIVDGELWMKSEAVMLGYYGDEEATGRVLKDGWYITGDLCTKDEEGYYYLIGRKKNIIILENGKNVSPEEIEKRLHEMADILDIVVRQEQGYIKAEILPEYPDLCTEEEKKQIQTNIWNIVRRYNESVPIYKQVRKIHFMSVEAAKTSAGKLIRKRR